jgi:probable rRNA maturation factor
LIEVIAEEPAWRASERRAAAIARAAAAATLKAERRRGADLTILLAADARVRALNATFRGRDQPTNVLSFPAARGAALGDIALAYGVCAREAAEQGKSLADHLSHLTTHGVLHLFGYDHETDADAALMEAKERAILASLGVADPYA